MISGLISGAGANAKALLSKGQYFDAVLKTAVSPKKIAMYSAKKIAIKKTIVNAAARFSTSILTGIGVGKGIGLAFGW